MTAATASICYRFAHYDLQPSERRLRASGKVVHLGPHAFDLLVTLAERSGHLVSKDELLGRVWGKVVVEENTLQTHISTLRKVLGPNSIATVSGRGYRFTLEVTPFDAAAPASARASKHNLPHDLTSFIGREREIAELTQLLGRARLLMLTGAGGCGKTRLAIELAKRQTHAYSEGAWLVELAALTDGALLPQTVATALSIQEKVGARITDTIAENLASCALLLVLDNAEHLIEACAQLAESLLRRCERLVILVTSREQLSVTGELVYRVPSLSVPDEESDTTPESIVAHESARLFIERARLQLPNFEITPRNSAAIASICRRLDGVALALELAAPRVRTLSVEELSRGLDRRFELLTEGSRTALPRHRTLRALINWSYDLLNDAEKAMLRSVSVFAGGWTLDAAEQVFGLAQPNRSSVLDLLTSLADKNLITVETHEGATRYGMLETVRDYGRDWLRETSEKAQLQDRHLAYFLTLAEEARRQRSATNAPARLDRLETERDNFRAALSWSIASHADDAGVRLAGALSWFWFLRGYATEGRRWLSATLADQDTSYNPAARILALRAVSMLAQRQGDPVVAKRMAEEALAISIEAGDRHGIAESWQSLAVVAHSQTDYRAARECYERAIVLLRELDDRAEIGVMLCGLGQMATAEGDYDEAGVRLAESVAIARAIGDWLLPNALTALGTVAHYQGNSELARSLLDEALTSRRMMAYREGTADSLVALAVVAHDCGDHSGAQTQLREALEIQRELGEPQAVANALDIFGEVAFALAGPVPAARLWGQAQRLREESASSTTNWVGGSDVTPTRRERRERDVAAGRATLGEEAFEVAWNEGRLMTLEQAVDFGLNVGLAGPNANGEH